MNSQATHELSLILPHQIEHGKIGSQIYGRTRTQIQDVQYPLLRRKNNKGKIATNKNHYFGEFHEAENILLMMHARRALQGPEEV